MNHDKDKILLRAKDIGLLIMIFTLLGFLVGPMKKIFQLEQTIEDVKELKKSDIEQKTSIAVIGTQLADIAKQLEKISWQLRRMDR